MSGSLGLAALLDPPRRVAPEPGEQGVSVRPIAVTICQKAAVLGVDQPRRAPPRPSTISVVSDGEAMSRLGLGRHRRAARPPSRSSSAGDHRLDQHHADQREQQLRPVGRR